MQTIEEQQGVRRKAGKRESETRLPVGDKALAFLSEGERARGGL